MRDLLVTLLIFGSIPVILVKPHVGVLVFSWISYMNPHRLTWGFAYNFHFALLVGATTIFAWLLSRESKRLPWTPVTVLLVAFTAWISITTYFATYPDAAYAKWDQTIKILIFNGFVTLGLMGSKERLNALIWVIVVSIGFFGVKGGIFTLLGGGAFHVYGPEGSFIGENNSLALALLTVLPLMRYLQLNTRLWWINWGLTAAMLLSLIAVLGSQSRGAFVGLTVMLLAFFIKSRKRLLISIGAVLVVALSISFMPEEWHTRMETIVEYQDDPSTQGRFEAWEFGFNVAKDHPIVGGGFGVFRGNTGEGRSWGRPAHSIYFQVLGEHGFVGLVLYLFLGAATFMAGSSIIRRTRGKQELTWARDLAGMTQVSLVTFGTAGAFLSLAYFDLVYHLVVIMVITSVLTREALFPSAKIVPVDEDSMASMSGPSAIHSSGIQRNDAK